MAARRTSSKRSRPEGKDRAASQSERLQQVEEMLELLLAASLRGRLLPSERRIVKRFIESRRKAHKKEKVVSRGPRCPACRSPLASARLKRCPWCGVLLAEVRKAVRASRKKR